MDNPPLMTFVNIILPSYSRSFKWILSQSFPHQMSVCISEHWPIFLNLSMKNIHVYNFQT